MFSVMFSLRGQGVIFLWASLAPSVAVLSDTGAEECAVETESVALIAHSISAMKIDAAIPAGFSKYRMVKDAAEIAMAVYHHGNVPGWTLIAAMSEGNDQVGLYQRDSTCVVAFAGSNDWGDWVDNFNVLTTRKCGLDFHWGLYRALEATVRRRGWLGIVNTLVGSTCGEIVLTGHSQGGGMASILAACANQNGGLRASFPQFPAFTVDGLYTIGAPGISKQRINNDQERNGCFSGMRVVNYDGGSYDPVPYIAHRFGFLHPPLEVTRTKMKTAWWTGRKTVTKESISCTSNEALDYPSTVRPWYTPLKSMHSDYCVRLKALVDTRGIVNR